MNKIKSKKETISVSIPLVYIEDWKSNFKGLAGDSVYELIIDYPISSPATFKIITNKHGMDAIQLMNKINYFYDKIYSHTDKYGVWGHCKEDLCIEGIYVDHERYRITLAIGS
jgi:hypothetical protein